MAAYEPDSGRVMDFSGLALQVDQVLNADGTLMVDGTVVVAGPAANVVALTDSTGYSGTSDDTLAATTVPAALTENSGAIGGTSDGNLPALVDPSGDAGASVIAGIRECATQLNTIRTLLLVMAQNQSDSGQKVNDVIAALIAADFMEA